MSEGIIEEKSASEGQIPESSRRIEDAKGNSSSKKKDYRFRICRWQVDHGITREVVEQLFDKSLEDAAKTLKVSTSTLKRACRDLGISRWPNRNRKRSNNSSLNQNDVQALKKHKGGTQPCPADAATNITMPVKVTYQNDTVAFRLSSSSTMKYLEEQLEMRFKIAAHKFCIKYQDEEDEWISIMCDLDLMYCMDVFRSCGKSIIRMRVTPKSLEFNPNPSSSSPLNENYFSSPVLTIQAAAQPPPNAASPTGKGVCREILEAPNTTPILLSEGNNTSLPQIVSHHSVNIEYFNQEDQELFNLAQGMMVTPPRVNYLSLPSPENFEWARQPRSPPQPNDYDSVILGGLPHMPVQLPVDLAVSSPMMSPHLFICRYLVSSTYLPSLPRFNRANLLPWYDDELPPSFTRFDRANLRRRRYDDEESSDVSQELENREENEIVRQSWFEILTLPLRSAWKAMLRIWRLAKQILRLSVNPKMT